MMFWYSSALANVAETLYDRIIDLQFIFLQHNFIDQLKKDELLFVCISGNLSKL